MGETIGFIGLGKMGLPMAEQLIKNHYELLGNDNNEEAIAQFVNIGGKPASIKEIVENANNIILMLPNSEIVDYVTSDIASAFSYKKDGNLTIIDMSSSYPTNTNENYRKFKDLGIQFLDAPVSGGVKKAITGKLTIMVGGDEEIFQKKKELFDTLGEKVFYIGPTGSGHLIKALNNYLSAVHMYASCEVIHYLKEFGLDPSTCIDAINQSTGRNLSTEYKFPNFILNETFNSGFSMGLMAKDVDTVRQLFNEANNESLLVDNIADAYKNAFEQFGVESDHTEIFKYVKKQFFQKEEILNDKK